MTPIIEHKNGDRISVRDDVAIEYVACVPCRGRGYFYQFIGSFGGLFSGGFRTAHFQHRWCQDCRGQGIWREASPVTSAQVKGDRRDG